MLSISQTIYNELRSHGEETYPNECCGILLGRIVNETNQDGLNCVTESLRAGNTRMDSAHNRYQIDPQEIIRAQKKGHEQGLEIVGFYHSHPDHPAHWSATDLAEAHWMGCSYIITAVIGGRATLTNSFRLLGLSEEDKHLSPEPIQLRPL
jgi:proteasome lid subunit RPN8/RPN11